MTPDGTRLRRLAAALLAGGGLAAALCLLAAPAAVHADVAPIPQQGESGHSLGPAGQTNVQMVSETVVLEVVDGLTFTLTENEFETERPGALVTADFLLRNPDSAAQRLTVGFPMVVPPAFDPNSFSDKATYVIEDLHALVNGAEQTTRQAVVAGRPWRVWDLDLPAGDTVVRVTYRQPAASPSSYSPDIQIGYVLQTGAAWAGVIEHADLIMRFQYPAETMFVAAGQSGFTVDGDALRWTYTNLEPAAQDDLLLTIVAPSFWRAVLDARRAMAAEPTAANYAALAGAYAAIVLPSRGPYNPDAGPSFNSPLIAQVAEAQLRKALELAPGDADIHGQYAQLLASLAGSLLPDARYADAFAEYAQTLALDPGSSYRDEYLFILDYSGERLPAGAVETATAIVPITAAPSATLAASATPAPPTATPSAVPTAAATLTQPPAVPSPTPAPPTATLEPTAAPAAETAAGPPWAAIVGFLALFALVAGAFTLLRRRPTR